MSILLMCGLFAALPCDGTVLDVSTWPETTDVRDLVTCFESVVQGDCPVADAGREQFATTGNPVTLDGSRATGPDAALTFAWRQVSNGAPAVVLTGADTATPSFTPSVPGTYEFDLDLTWQCLRDSDRVRVVVADQLSAPQTLNFTLVADQSFLPTRGGGFTPAQVQQAPGQPDRLYIVTLEGRIWILEGGSILPEPFLDLSSLIDSCFECNLMSMAFPPDFAVSGLAYVKYVGRLLDGSGSGTDVRIAGFPPDMEREVRGIANGVDLLTIPKPTDIHAGGTVAFGPDGLLYIATGDSGPQGDPNHNAQNTMLPLGKLLRYQVDGLNPLTIPDTNPFLDDAGILDEIFAIGFRNPWRMTFDRETGDIFIGDNGQFEVEEVSMLSGDSPGGVNFGWDVVEGNQCFNPPVGCDDTGLEPPIHTYLHSARPETVNS